MNNPMMFGGFRVFIKSPYKTFKKRIGLSKLKKRKKMQKYFVFTGWQKLLEDGEIIKDEINMAIYMNNATWDRVRKAIDAQPKPAFNY